MSSGDQLPDDYQAPYAAGSDTSRAAARGQQLFGNAQSTARRVFDAIEAAGETGLTCLEIEQQLTLLHQTAAARIRDLASYGWVVDSGERREGRSGPRNNLMTVWRAAPVENRRLTKDLARTTTVKHFLLAVADPPSQQCLCTQLPTLEACRDAAAIFREGYPGFRLFSFSIGRDGSTAFAPLD